MGTPQGELRISLLQTLVQVGRLARSPMPPGDLLRRTCDELQSGLACSAVQILLTGADAQELLAGSSCWLTAKQGGVASFSSGAEPPCIPALRDLSVGLTLPEFVEAAMAGGGLPVVRRLTSDCADSGELPPTAGTLLVVPIQSEESVFGALAIRVAESETVIAPWLASGDLAELGESIGASLMRILRANRAEQASRSIAISEERYAELVKTLGGFSWEVNGEGVYTHVGPGILDLLGWATEDVVGKKTCFDLFAPEERESVEKAARENMGAGVSINGLETTLVRRDGTRVAVSTTGFPLRDTAGRVVGYRGIDLDVTRWKANETERQQASKRTFLQRTALAQLLSTEHSKSRGDRNYFRFVTEALATALGASRTSLWELSGDGANLLCVDLYDATNRTHSSGQAIATRLFPEYFEAIRQEAIIAVEDALTDPRTAGLVQFYSLPSGVLSMLDAGLFSEGALTGVICVESVDAVRRWHPDEASFVSAVATLTGQRFAEHRVRQVEERLRLALRAANQGIYDLDLRSGEAVVSDEYASMLGYDPATFRETNQKWIERLHPGDSQRVAAIFRDYAERRLSEYRVEFRQRCADGTWKWILSLGSAVEWDEAGLPVRMVGTHTDISRLKELELNLREREKESRCLFEVGQVVRTPSNDDLPLLQPCAESVLRAMAHPELMRVRIECLRTVAEAGNRDSTAALFEVPLSGGGNKECNGLLMVFGPGPARGVESEPIGVLHEEVEMLREVARILESELRRRAADRQLTDKQTLLTSAEAVASMGSWVLDLPANELSWSDQVFAIFGIDPGEFGASYETFLSAIHPDDREAVARAYETSLGDGSSGYEIRHRIVRADNGEVRHVHERCVHTRQNGKVLRSLGTVQDVTEQEEATRRVIRESGRRAALQEAATLLASAPHAEADAAVERVLGIIGTFAHADRAYVFQFDWERRIADNTHEWCRDGVTPMIDRLRNVPMEEAQELVDSIRNGVPLWIPVVSALTNDDEKRFLEAQGIRSILMMPLMQHGQCQGLVGFDWVHEERDLLDSHVEILEVLSGLLLSHLGRVSAWRALEENEERYRLLFSSLTQGVVVHDSTGAIIDCNPSAESILGMSRDMIVGRDSHDPQWRALREDGTPFPADEHPAMVALRTGRSCVGVVVGLPMSGATRWIRINATPTADLRSVPLVFVTFDDITAQREAEAAIRILAAQAEQAPFAILRTGVDRRIVWGNKAFTELTGFQIDEVIGRRPSEFLHGPDTSRETVAKMRRHLNALKTVSVEILKYSKTKTPYWIELTIAPLHDSAGKHTGYVEFGRDVTERVRAQTSLREATQRLSLLNDDLENRVAKRTKEVRRQAAVLDNSFEGVAMYRHGHCIYRNTAHQRLFGEAAERLGWREIITPAPAEDLPPHGDRMEVRMMEARATAVDGRPLELEVDVMQLQEDVEVLVTRDVTERRRSARELAEAKRFLETILDSFPIAVFWKDTDSRYLGCNQEFARYAHMEPSKVAGRTDQEMPWGGTRADEARSEDLRVMQAGLSFLGKLNHLVDDNGSGQWFETNKVPLRDSEGSVIGLVGSFQDVTARVVAQTALQEREARYHALMENAGDMIVIADADGKLIEANQAAESFLGYSRSQLKSMHVSNLHRSEDLPVALAHFQRIVRERHAVARGRDIPMVKADGSIVYADVTGTLVSIGERAVVQGIFHDATERRERETVLMHLNQKLAEATRQKDEFLANMSHELRTPLNAILGMSEALAIGVYGELTARQIESLKRIEFSGRHLLSLINDILDLAKIEAGRIVLEPESVNVRDLVTSMSRLLEENANAKAVRLSTEVDGAVTELTADPRRLRQILLNLLSNALKFTESGGSVCLRVKLEAENRRMVFEVSDTGEGIPAEKIDRLFKPFTQLESPLTKRHAGTGLGLSIVKRLVEMHGGNIYVLSEVGKGSTFEVSLPWSPSLPSSDGTQVGQATLVDDLNSRSFSRILLVEDNDNNIAIVRDFLEATGYIVEVATNGAEAVRMVEQGAYVLILMDVQMPEMDGLEATRRIRQIKGKELVPIIALTSFAMPGDRERCLNAGMTDYMAKPVSLRTLKATIRTHLRARKG